MKRLLLALVLLLPFSLFASTVTTIPVTVPGVSSGTGGYVYLAPTDYTVSGTGPVTITYPSKVVPASTNPLSPGVDVSIPRPSAPGVAAGYDLVPLAVTYAPDVARVAAAAVNLLRGAGPLGMMINLATLVCTTTNLCKSSDGSNTLQYNVPGSTWTVSDQYWGTGKNGSGSSPLAACQNFALNMWNDPPNYASVAANETNYSGGYATCRIAGVSYAFTAFASTYPNAAVQPTTRTPTDADFTAAINALKAATGQMNATIAQLQTLNQPVPINAPVLSSPPITSPPVSTVQRDGAGNIVSTTTTSYTTTITNNTTSNTPAVDVTQVTNTTVTDSTGATTSSTSTTAPVDPNKTPPTDPTIDFDSVPDVPLTAQQLPLSMAAPVSWGEGSCPPDPVTFVRGTSITIPIHTVCDYMTGIRTAVLLGFALLSAYIVIGVKQEA